MNATMSYYYLTINMEAIYVLHNEIWATMVLLRATGHAKSGFEQTNEYRDREK